MECSAKDERGIIDLFKAFLTLAKISLPNSGELGSGLKRRSSAYHSRNKEKSSTTTTTTSSSEQFLSADTAQKSKPRSRSLIRRSSRKAKEQVRDASTGGPSECQVN